MMEIDLKEVIAKIGGKESEIEKVTKQLEGKHRKMESLKKTFKTVIARLNISFFVINRCFINSDQGLEGFLYL